MDADDSFGSGVKQITYSVDGNSQTTVLGDHVDFILSCPSDWGCVKNIDFFAEDIAGNIEDTVSYPLTIVDKGSACQSDCSARPAPNRYLKDCRNLNGCSFYPFNNLGQNDDGEYVAEQCNMVAIGEDTYFNETHDITCPAGPFKKTRFSTDNLYFLDSFCDNIVKTPYPIVLGGQQLIMNVISCFNE